MQDFEKLAAFYLGRRHDVDSGETTDETLLYDAKDLTTHAVCVGMTGSGKTGLCISLLEEAAIDGIPALVIDPKGDMSNLLLSFPNLAQSDFEPWVDPAEAERKGMEPPAYAASVAETWKQGLADWGQDGARIQRLKDSADFAVYTPGSTAGIPLTVLRSFAAPPAEQMEDAELLADRIHGASAGLLGLLGIDADPIQSREAILVGNILQHHWKAGRSLGIADLVREIQSPPFERLGVLDLDSFYPAKERLALAMSLNGLLASPSFAQWMEGEALDVAKLLHTDKGKPRISILSISHLSESERMFFVTLLLNEVVSWMRTQTGTSSLRAILYMDEIFGYFPPTKEPPSKKPMLTLLKQARAFGLGVCLSTQNPVDLDYKGLSNTGTWFLGRLQTERDKARVLDGLEGAMTGGGKTFDRSRLDALLSGLGKRVFLMHNVHDDQPVVFRTRWAMSYLRGPLSRDHLRILTAQHAPAEAAPSPAASVAPAAVPAAKPATPEPAPAAEEAVRPVLPPEVREHFLESRRERGDDRLVYRPTVVAETQLHYANVRAKVDTWVKVAVRAPLHEDEPAPDWEAATLFEGRGLDDFDSEPEAGATFAGLPSSASKAKSYTAWQRSLKNHMYKTRALTMWKSGTYRLVSELGESERDFRSRVADAAREKRDEKIEKLRDRYAPKLARVQERIRKAEQKIEREEEQYREKRSSSFVSVGSTILGALFGRKLASAGNVRRAGSAAKSVGRVSKEKADIERAKEDLEAQHHKLAELEAEFTESLGELDVRVRADEMELDEITVRPRKSDTEVTHPAILWTPWTVDASGIARPAFD